MFAKPKTGALVAASLSAAVAGVLTSSANAAVVIASTDTVLDAPITLGANLLDPTSKTGQRARRLGRQ